MNARRSPRRSRQRPMKRLVIQIPAWNEEESLPGTLAALPRGGRRFRRGAPILVVDDGSTDGTAGAARGGRRPASCASGDTGVSRRRSARASTASLELGADVIVNLDADGQYDPGRHPGPRRADPRGARRPRHRGPRPGHARALLALEAPPAAARQLGRRAGGRARSRRRDVGISRLLARGRAADQRLLQDDLHARDDHPGRLEGAARRLGSGARAARPRAARASCPPSPHYVLVQGANILRITALYKPLKLFSAAAAAFRSRASSWARATSTTSSSPPRAGGHVQSLILAAVLVLVGALTFLIALLADLVSINRTLLEELKLKPAEAQRLTADADRLSGPVPRLAARAPARPRAASGSPACSRRPRTGCGLPPRAYWLRIAASNWASSGSK